MKKIIPICLVGILLGTTFGAAVQKNDGENQTITLQTHKVFGEYGTATWCGYCKYAHGALKALKAGFWHDFFYVSLVDDKNTHAAARNTQMGITGFPTVWWDGKYRTNVGAGSIPSAMAAYNTSILSCGARTVPNINLTIDAIWLGSASMSITVIMTNYETSTYTGYLRCYVTEIVSSMGWVDTAGKPYTFPFLDYAFDQSISAPGGGTWSSTITWVGADHNDGYGHTFSGITQANTYIIAAVFASSGGYVDEAAGDRLGNNSPPNEPNTPNPTDGATNIALSPTLSWQCTDPDWYDTLYFDIYFEQDDSTPDVLVSEHQTGRTYKPETLSLDSTYYWQLVVKDSLDLAATGPVWSFTTRGNNPPNSPNNPNPSNGSTGVPLNKILGWTGGDPDGDIVKYDVYFGKTNPPSKVVNNQTSISYNPGVLDPLTTYYWEIVAWDSFGATTIGQIWQFTSSTAPNHPPDIPIISGPAQGKKGVNYTYNVTGIDSDGNNISFYVDWGDNTNSGWLGPYASGYLLNVYHQWSSKGAYIIKAKVRDEHGLESDWATLDITMPKNLDYTNLFIHWLFEHFPNAFPILRQFLGV